MSDEPPRDSRKPAGVQLLAFEPRLLSKSVLIIFVMFLGLLIVQAAFEAVGHFLFILLLAFLSAIAMEPIVRRLATRGWRRGLATGTVMLLLFLVTLLFSLVFGGLFAQQVASLIENFPTAVTSTVTWVNDTFHTTLNSSTIVAQLNLSTERLAELASSFAGGLLGLLGSVVGGIFDAVAVVVFAFYLSADGPRLRRTIGSWLPEGPQKVFVTVWDIAVDKTGGFVISKVALAALSSVAHSLAFAVIGVPFWLPMGILAGVTSQFIPTIGTYIGILIPAMFALAEGSTITVIWIIAFATVYQQVENYLLMPRISRWTMNLHPAVALASVFVGLAFFGPIGALIGMPIAAAVLAVVETYGRRYELIPELRAATTDTTSTTSTTGTTDRPEPRSAESDQALLDTAWQRERELDERERLRREAERAASRHPRGS